MEPHVLLPYSFISEWDTIRAFTMFSLLCFGVQCVKSTGTAEHHLSPEIFHWERSDAHKTPSTKAKLTLLCWDTGIN